MFISKSINHTENVRIAYVHGCERRHKTELADHGYDEVMRDR